MAGKFGPNIFQAALIQVAEGLVGNPQWTGFDNASAELGIRAFLEWYWSLCQCLVAIDEGYQQETNPLNADPMKQLEMTTASADTRGRGTKLYALLSHGPESRRGTLTRSGRTCRLS